MLRSESLERRPRRSSNPWTLEEIEEKIVSRRKDGETVRDIAKRLGISSARVDQLCAKVGYRPGHMKVTRTKGCRVCFAVYPEGKYREHCTAAGHRYSTVRRSTGVREVAVKLYLEHPEMTTVDIAEALGCHGQEVIYRYLKQSGLRPNRGGGRYVRTARSIERMKRSRGYA